jgi:PleD family two-component response regulator
VTGEGLSLIEEYSALIMGCLHITPSEDIDEFFQQANKALWFAKNILHPPQHE